MYEYDLKEIACRRHLLAKFIMASVPCKYASVARGATAVNANERKNRMRQY